GESGVFFATNLFVRLAKRYARKTRGMVRMKSGKTTWISGALAWSLAAFLPDTARAGGLNHVENVKLSAHPIAGGGVGSDIAIATSEAARYSARLLDGGKRLLIDISDADVTFADGAISDRTGVVTGVLTQAFRDASGSVVRVAITLSE